VNTQTDDNKPITRKMLFTFPECETEKPIVYHLVKDYDLVINIFRAKVTPDESGYLVLDITGTEENIRRGIDYVTTFNVTIDETNKGVSWKEEVCTSCGNCLTHCPTGALSIEDRTTMAVKFNGETCIECLSCVRICPFGACVSVF
jgi:L-aspartate semialdehyde sulfurtransferase ferredoxin